MTWKSHLIRALPIRKKERKKFPTAHPDPAAALVANF
jgi:hypothetical protein